MSQTAYNLNINNPFAGMKGDGAPSYTRSYTSEEASAEIPFGVALKQGTADDGALLPTSSADKFIGILQHSHAYDKFTELGTTGLKPKAELSIMRSGTIYVQVEEAVVAGDGAFIRYAAGGGGSQKGAFRKSADTATAVDVTAKAKYLTSAGANGFALLAFDFQN